MLASIKRTGAIAQRVLQQLRHDHRFLALSLLMPMAIVYVLFIFFDSLSNPLFNATPYVLPFAAFEIHFITFILTAIVLVRERVSETLSRMLVNGYRQSEIILGYLIAYTVLATLQSLIVLVEITWLFELDYAFGALASMYLVIWLLAVISMALGILISNFAQTEGQVIPFIPLVLLPSIFLSGVVLPIDALPTWVQRLSLLTPLYYANELLGPLVRGDALGHHLAALGALPLYGLLVLIIARFTLSQNE
ncbi:MAG: ABC transporter permease [Chloroflexi bacterium]|nr:ABC transporter permease [Chloroflexota bacterium]MQC25952.1 ABC transporter permease [Chloroflexota bacterium]